MLDAVFLSRGFDATHLTEQSAVTADTILADRLRMKLILSRHGRVDFDSWKDKDVLEMRQALDMLLDILKNERPDPIADPAG